MHFSGIRDDTFSLFNISSDDIISHEPTFHDDSGICISGHMHTGNQQAADDHLSADGNYQRNNSDFYVRFQTSLWPVSYYTIWRAYLLYNIYVG